MPYDLHLADRIREYLATKPSLNIEEKEMFRGLTFMVNGKMCVCVSGDKLMCRFDPDRNEEVAEKPGFENMVMKEKVIKASVTYAPRVLNQRRTSITGSTSASNTTPKPNPRRRQRRNNIPYTVRRSFSVGRQPTTYNLPLTPSAEGGPPTSFISLPLSP